MKSLTITPNIIVAHNNRIICDDEVYEYSDTAFTNIQTLDQEDLTGGCPISDRMIVFGHFRYTKLSIWEWNGTQYTCKDKKLLSTYSSPSQVTQIQPLKNAQMQILCVVGTHNLYLIKVNEDNLKASERVKIVHKNTSIIDYKQVDD